MSYRLRTGNGERVCRPNQYIEEGRASSQVVVVVNDSHPRKSSTRVILASHRRQRESSTQVVVNESSMQVVGVWLVSPSQCACVCISVSLRLSLPKKLFSNLYACGLLYYFCCPSFPVTTRRPSWNTYARPPLVETSLRRWSSMVLPSAEHLNSSKSIHAKSEALIS